ncbi:MAG: slipin family protein [Planctomycetota bacterium]|jgi:regulator of protease activity HflC (stomatin/prohibitin superfamily)
MEYLITAIVVVGLAVFLRFGVRRITITEYEKGLKYRTGKFDSVLKPGQYWYMPLFVAIRKLDVRPRFVSIMGQEVLSSDGVALKISLAANFEIAEPSVAVNRIQNFQEALYVELQLALREIIGSSKIEAILESRGEISKRLMEMTEDKVGHFGLKLLSVDVKDIMLPGKLKDIFAQVVNARQEGLAALERARGETAALRNLANAAKMIDTNPNLMQLRLVQTLGESSGNTLLLEMPAQETSMSAAKKKAVSKRADKKTR